MVVRSSFVGCPAPVAAEVWLLAQSFPGLGVVAVRPSRRSFSGWVVVCSFASELVACAFAARAASRFFGLVVVVWCGGCLRSARSHL